MRETNSVSNRSINIDEIEVNALMPLYSEFDQVSDITEKYVLYACALFYCGICPLTIFIIVGFFYIDNWLSNYTNCYVMQRRLTDHEKDILVWNNFADIMVILVIITNSLLLFGVDTSYTFFLENYVRIRDGYAKVWFVFGVEHCILLILFLIREIIPDIPFDIRMRLHRIY